MKAKRRIFTAAFKVSIAIEAFRERETMAELSRRYEIHPNMISKRKQEFLERSSEIFETRPLLKKGLKIIM
jgi:transposase